MKNATTLFGVPIRYANVEFVHPIEIQFGSHIAYKVYKCENCGQHIKFFREPNDREFACPGCRGTILWPPVKNDEPNG